MKKEKRMLNCVLAGILVASVLSTDSWADNEFAILPGSERVERVLMDDDAPLSWEGVHVCMEKEYGDTYSGSVSYKVIQMNPTYWTEQLVGEICDLTLYPVMSWAWKVSGDMPVALSLSVVNAETGERRWFTYAAGRISLLNTFPLNLNIDVHLSEKVPGQWQLVERKLLRDINDRWGWTKIKLTGLMLVGPHEVWREEGDFALFDAIKLVSTKEHIRVLSVQRAEQERKLTKERKRIQKVIKGGDTLIFDFGTEGSPVLTNSIAETTERYTPIRGYGWVLIESPAAFDRGEADELRRDLVCGRRGIYRIDVPNGYYKVVLSLGDLSALIDRVRILAQGLPVAQNLKTLPDKRFIEVDFVREVLDGKLVVKLHDDGGTGPLWAVNGLSIRKASKADVLKSEQLHENSMAKAWKELEKHFREPYFKKEKRIFEWDAFAYGYKDSPEVIGEERLGHYWELLEPWWIWAPLQGDPRRYPPEVCYFRKEFNIKGSVLSALLIIAAKDDYQLYVNGRYVGSGDPKSYNVLKEYDVTKMMRDGKNVIAIRGVVSGGLRGVYVQGRVVYENKKEVVELGIVSDEEWQVSRKRIGGWNKADLNTSDWEYAQVLWNPHASLRSPWSGTFAVPPKMALAKDYRAEWTRERFYYLHFTPRRVVRRKRKKPIGAEDKIEDLARLEKARIAILRETGFPNAGPEGFTPKKAKAVLEEVGHAVTLLSVDELSNEKVFNNESFDVLILPYGSNYPVEIEQNTYNFMKQGGYLFLTDVLTEPYYRSEEGGWERSRVLHPEGPLSGWYYGGGRYSWINEQFGGPKAGKILDPTSWISKRFYSIDLIAGYRGIPDPPSRGTMRFSHPHCSLANDYIIPLAEALDEYGLPVRSNLIFQYPIPIYILCHDCEFYGKSRVFVTALGRRANPLSPELWPYADRFLIQSIQNLLQLPSIKPIKALPLPAEKETRWTVRKVGDRNVMYVNGEPAVGTYNPYRPHNAGWFLAYAEEVGINRIQIWTEWIGIPKTELNVEASKRMWFDGLEEFVRFYSRFGKAITISLNTCGVPWWLKAQYPDRELSPFDPVFQEELLSFLREAIKRTAKYPAVDGYIFFNSLMNMGEGGIAFKDFLPGKVGEPGVSPWKPGVLIAFRKWLREKYGTVKNLKKAWNREDIYCFDDIDEVVVKKPNKDGIDLRQEYLDWREFGTDFLLQRMEEWGGRLVKEIAPDKLVMCSYLGAGARQYGINPWKLRYFKYVDCNNEGTFSIGDPWVILSEHAIPTSIWKHSAYKFCRPEWVLQPQTGTINDYAANLRAFSVLGYVLGDGQHYFETLCNNQIGLKGMRDGHKVYREVVSKNHRAMKDIGAYYSYHAVYTQGRPNMLELQFKGLSRFLWLYERLPSYFSELYPDDIFDYNIIYVPDQIVVPEEAEKMMEDFARLGGGIIKTAYVPYGLTGERKDFLSFPYIERRGEAVREPSFHVVEEYPLSRKIGYKGEIPLFNLLSPVDVTDGRVLARSKNGYPVIVVGNETHRSLFMATPLLEYTERDVFDYNRVLDELLYGYVQWVESLQKEEVMKELARMEQVFKVSTEDIRQLDELGEWLLARSSSLIERASSFFEMGLYMRALVDAKCAVNGLAIAQHLSNKRPFPELPVESIVSTSNFARRELESCDTLMENVGRRDVPSGIDKLVLFLNDLVNKEPSVAFAGAKLAREALVELEYERWTMLHERLDEERERALELSK